MAEPTYEDVIPDSKVFGTTTVDDERQYKQSQDIRGLYDTQRGDTRNDPKKKRP